MFALWIVVMVSWVYTYITPLHNVDFKIYMFMCLLCLNKAIFLNGEFKKNCLLELPPRIAIRLREDHLRENVKKSA